MHGKIEVRWWLTGAKNTRGFLAGPQPTMAQWSEKGLPEPIPPTDLIRRANKRAGFKKNYKDTCLILSYLTQLFVARKKLLDIISEFNRSTSLFKKLNQIPLLMAHKMGTFTKIEARIDTRGADLQ